MRGVRLQRLCGVEVPEPRKIFHPGHEEEGAQGKDGSQTPSVSDPVRDMGKTSKDHQSPSAYQQRTQACLNLTSKKGLQPTPPSESKVGRSPFLPVINTDRLRTAKALVDEALQMRKVFSIRGHYPVVRSVLRARGWVERRLPQQSQRCRRLRVYEDDDGMDTDDSDDDDNPRAVLKEENPEDMHDIMSRMVRTERTNLYWKMCRGYTDTGHLQKEQKTNHSAKTGIITSKVGLCVNMRNLKWFAAADPDTFFPRCYRLGAADEKFSFIEDYRRTACTSLLKCVVERSERVEGQKAWAAGEAKQSGRNKSNKRKAVVSVSCTIIDFALEVCQHFLDSLDHKDIDLPLDTPSVPKEEQWSMFIHNYYRVVHDGVRIEGGSQYVGRCQSMLQELQDVSPQLDTDGTHNVWIVKPGAMSRGRGITCAKRIDEILKVVDSDPALDKDDKWVVQKYLERPLLVHNTKFDLRQWFLVTDWNPLTVWFYNKCYMRFSTQPYSVANLDRSIHLCNNSVQKHLQPSQRRHPDVPADNMWSCDQFKAFLSRQGQAAEWESVVVPGMKKAIVHALKTAQDLVEPRRGSFQLYGADFMLGHDLKPWLIEINSSPAMAPSTPVTARLCAQVQEDVLRVVLDRRLDKKAQTGGFELIWKQAAVEVPPYVGVSFVVEGTQIPRPRPFPPPKGSKPSEPRTRRCLVNKETRTETTNTTSKRWMRTGLQPLTLSSNKARPPPHPDPPPETLRPHPCITIEVVQPHHRAPVAHSRTMECWRRPQVIKPRSVQNQKLLKTLYQGPVHSLGVTRLQDPGRKVPDPSFRFSQHRDLHPCIVRAAHAERGLYKTTYKTT